MASLGCCSVDELSGKLNDRQRSARAVVGVASLTVAVLAARSSGAIGVLGAAGAGWFGASHLVAARTGYAGCPELGAIPSVVLGWELQVGCVPWRIADRRLGLAT
jgi:hypothetical protein